MFSAGINISKHNVLQSKQIVQQYKEITVSGVSTSSANASAFVEFYIDTLFIINMLQQNTPIESGCFWRILDGVCDSRKHPLKSERTSS